MNNTFNLQRFGLLLKRQWLEFGKIYLVSLVVALGVIITFYGFTLWPFLIQTIKEPYEFRLNFREPLFLIFSFIFLSIIASNYFAHLGQKPKAIIDLLIPASTFEKFLTGIFFTSVLALASFIFLFYITDLAFITKLRDLYQDGARIVSYTDTEGDEIKKVDKLMYFFSKNAPNFFKPLYLFPFFVTSIFLLGSIYFNKFHYIKTAISLMIFSGILSATLFKAGGILFQGKIMIQQEDRNMNHLPQSTVEWLGLLLLAVLILIIWSITYIRLKEKEV
jgi:hypothetical protein